MAPFALPFGTMTTNRPKTLCIDIGGSGIKGMVLCPEGTPLVERQRLATPRPASPQAVLETIAQLAGEMGSFDRVSVGFPGVVDQGVVRTGVNLDGAWAGMPLAQAVSDLTGKPCRAANDADIQGYGAIEGLGVEMMITLGTGMGAAIFSDGKLVPNLELGHHPLAEGQSYEELLGQAALDRLGLEAWQGWLQRAIDTILPIWNPRVLYIGGGNARHLPDALPAKVQRVRNIAGILGGIRLWQNRASQ